MTLEEALAWIANIFEEAVDNIKPETARDDIKYWDSLGVLSLMAGLDEEFDIQLSEDELQEMRTIEDILKVLRKHGQLS